MTPLDRPERRLIIGLAAALLGLIALSLRLGPYPLPLLDTIADLWAGGRQGPALVLLELRLPRTLIAALVGASLGLCGAAIQGLLRNPLACPGLIGSAQGAALGSVALMYYGLPAAGAAFLTPLGGILGALAATLAAWRLAGPDAPVTTLILAGVAVSALASSLVAVLLNLAPSAYAVQEIVLWLLGSVANRSNDDLWLLLPPTLLGWALLIGIGRGLDALALGSDAARSLGVDLASLQRRVFFATALAVGAGVAVSGVIGFIGLVVPHLLRPRVGFQPSRLLWPSALGGAALLVAADCATRLMPAGRELQVGVVTALIGAPFFLHLILQTKRSQLS